jgi:Tfp pilus assembly protein PilO
MYSKRNSLTILLVLLLLSGGGFFWYRSEARELSQVRAKNGQLNTQLRGALEVVQTLTTVQADYDSMFLKWKNAPKKLLSTQKPAFSLSYINWLINVHNLDLDFDFFLNDRKVRNEFTVFSYTLNGEGDYHNICSLIWYITRNPILYQIKSVNFKRKGDDPRILNFVVTFEGYSMTKSWEVGSEVSLASLQFDWETEFAFDAFRGVLAPVKPVSAPAALRPAQAPGAPRSSRRRAGQSRGHHQRQGISACQGRQDFRARRRRPGATGCVGARRSTAQSSRVSA